MSIKKRKPLFERLEQGLQEGIAHTRGELTLKTVEIPEEPPEIDAKTLAAIRSQAAMSQSIFARVLNVSYKTVQSWEQGLREPSHASRRLLQVFVEHPEIVCQTVGLPAVTLHGVAIQEAGNGRRKVVIGSMPNRTSLRREPNRRKKDGPMS
jgi:putative transcriptional regulator